MTWSSAQSARPGARGISSATAAAKALPCTPAWAGTIGGAVRGAGAAWCGPAGLEDEIHAPGRCDRGGGRETGNARAAWALADGAAEQTSQSRGPSPRPAPPESRPSRPPRWRLAWLSGGRAPAPTASALTLPAPRGVAGPGGEVLELASASRPPRPGGPVLQAPAPWPGPARPPCAGPRRARGRLAERRGGGGGDVPDSPAAPRERATERSVASTARLDRDHAALCLRGARDRARRWQPAWGPRGHALARALDLAQQHREPLGHAAEMGGQPADLVTGVAAGGWSGRPRRSGRRPAPAPAAGW